MKTGNAISNFIARVRGKSNGTRASSNGCLSQASSHTHQGFLSGLRGRSDNNNPSSQVSKAVDSPSTYAEVIFDHNHHQSSESTSSVDNPLSIPSTSLNTSQKAKAVLTRLDSVFEEVQQHGIDHSFSKKLSTVQQAHCQARVDMHSLLHEGAEPLTVSDVSLQIEASKMMGEQRLILAKELMAKIILESLCSVHSRAQMLGNENSMPLLNNTVQEFDQIRLQATTLMQEAQNSPDLFKSASCKSKLDEIFKILPTVQQQLTTLQHNSN